MLTISDMPGFGSFGAYVDGLDLSTVTEEQWMELGQLFIDRLVVVFRSVVITKTQFLDWIPKLGPLRATVRLYFNRKYGVNFDATRPETWNQFDEQDQKWLRGRQYQLEPSGDGRFLTRIHGQQDAEGHHLGYFSHGDVNWHCDESSMLTFTPAAALLGWQHMKGSCTSFVQTVDLYESIPDSLRRELDDMVLVHRYQKGRINEAELYDDDLALHMRMGWCPVDEAETPMVCSAPNGRRGLRYSINTRYKIKGASEQESQQTFDHLESLLFDPRWICDHHYETDHDMIWFDNSVTLHRRLGGHKNRKAFRQQFDVSPLLAKPWRPWGHHAGYDAQYHNQMLELISIMGGDLAQRIKLPELDLL